jgi:hypothetical protein
LEEKVVVRLRCNLSCYLCWKQKQFVVGVVFGCYFGAEVKSISASIAANTMAARFHSGLISLSELKLEYMKAHRHAYGERMTEAQEQQLERRLTKLCQVG